MIGIYDREPKYCNYLDLFIAYLKVDRGFVQSGGVIFFLAQFDVFVHILYTLTMYFLIQICSTCFEH